MPNFISILTLFITILTFNPLAKSELDTYIVHLETPENHVYNHAQDLDEWYHSFLPQLNTSFDDPRMLYCFHNVFRGFAAKLSPDHVKAMEDMPGFISARPQSVASPSTTHTPNFLGLHVNTGLWRDSNYGKGVIIGVLDTGVLPGHPSFSDQGMPLPPAKWKGRCEFNSTYSCNNKIIGARYFQNGGGTPLDDDGHGTHVAGTAAGNFVSGANVFGNANGTAVGVAPLSHLAIYRVCNSFRCFESDILAAMDVAIDEGVDILSLSIQGLSGPFYDNNVALGAFSAMERGIFVSCAAGNSGPSNQTLSNDAPWILTVGASTIDRKIVATALLGNGEEYEGEALFQPRDFNSTLLPLVYAGMNLSNPSARFCGSGSLNNTDVKGKIVLCEVGAGISSTSKELNVKAAGGTAMILMNQESQGYSISVGANVLPGTHVSYVAGEMIKAYINTTVMPTATVLFKGTVIGDKHAPMVASFSSRGPSRASPGILKPDIIGPGVNILAAWPESVENNTGTNSTFNIISGTSMSCPHLSGVAALLKAVHPTWSTAAIKSAIMTTADIVNLNNTPIEDEKRLPANVFAVGSGHVNPPKANDPGLVYDIQAGDYVPYLCGLNYTDRQIQIILQRKVNCSEQSSIAEAELNYPSFSIRLGSTAQSYNRTVTNVGGANEVYTAEITPPPGVQVTVVPATLNFSELNQKLTYQVTFSRSSSSISSTQVQGYLRWVSARHSVRSPIAVAFGF